MGELLYEWNDLEGATRHLTEGIELGERSGSTNIVFPGHALLARVKCAQGDVDGAIHIIQGDEWSAHGMNLSSRELNRTAVQGARLRLAKGDVGAAARLLGQRGISVDEHVNHLNIFEHVMLARVLIARGEYDAALALLGRSLGWTEATGSKGIAIEVLAVEVLANAARDYEARAMIALAQALSLAEPEGYVRTFVDEGEPMAALLSKFLKARRTERLPSSQDGSTEYVDALLAAFRGPSGADAPQTAQPFTEPLSERELEVLQLVAAGKSNREISDRTSRHASIAQLRRGWLRTRPG
jgi:ATP/maltotriose-dependent transcriptional regulator MalT